MAQSKAQELLSRIAAQQEEVSALQTLWASLFPEFTNLGVRQYQVWLKLYDFALVVEGLQRTNVKLSQRQNSEVGPMDCDQVVRYASGVMKGLKLKGGAE